MDAIVYTTNTGSSERYADLLAHETQLPVYSLAEAGGRLRQGAEIIYLGWVMASSVKGYAAAAKRYSVRAVCPVGMGQTGTQTEQIRAKNNIPAEVPVFTLQGNFDLKKTQRHVPPDDEHHGQSRREKAVRKARQNARRG